MTDQTTEPRDRIATIQKRLDRAEQPGEAGFEALTELQILAPEDLAWALAHIKQLKSNHAEVVAARITERNNEHASAHQARSDLAALEIRHDKLIEDLFALIPEEYDGDDPAEEIVRKWAKDAADALAKVHAFVHARREFVGVLRQYSTEDRSDYHRWTGHAEARRELAESLGLELDPQAGGLLTPPDGGDR
jgi:hypothetical protein